MVSSLAWQTWNQTAKKIWKYQKKERFTITPWPSRHETLKTSPRGPAQGVLATPFLQRVLWGVSRPTCNSLNSGRSWSASDSACTQARCAHMFCLKTHRCTIIKLFFFFLTALPNCLTKHVNRNIPSQYLQTMKMLNSSHHGLSFAVVWGSGLTTRWRDKSDQALPATPKNFWTAS